jgi:hypothetical protein
MNEYRVTRRQPYMSPNCPGHADVSARQGYYIDAPNAEEARKEMAKRFPGEAFDVQTWKENVR